MSIKFKFKVVDKDLGWKTVKRNVDLADGRAVLVGIFDGQISEYAHHNEYGSPRANIPKRPFMRNAFDQNKQKYLDVIANAYKEISAPTSKDIRRTLIKLGNQARTDIIKSISQGGWKANAPSTVARKGSSKPLVDTGAMQRAITFLVGKAVDILKK